MTTIKFTKSSCQTVNIDNAVDGIQMTRKKVQNNKTFFMGSKIDAKAPNQIKFNLFNF